MDAKGLLHFQVNGSFGLLTEVAEGASDAEWSARSVPQANLVGFTVWHCARTIDWAVNCVMRGAPELADLAEWQDVKVAKAMFGAGASREIADAVAREVPRARVSAYVGALRQNVVDCFAVAKQLSDPGLKASMLQMAQSWLTLADRAEQRGRGNCKACDLPLPASTKRRK